MKAQEIIERMLSKRDEAQRENLMRFFRTGKGEYGEGDEFLGIKVPATRVLVKEVDIKDIGLEDINTLLQSKWHEVRLCGLLLLVRMAERAAKLAKKSSSCSPSLDTIVRFYIDHAECANNWDLVDLSTPKIVGLWLMTSTEISPEEKLKMVDALALSGSLWRQRIAMVCTWTTSKLGNPSFVLRYAEILLNHPHDLMHKAVGWMLREMGNSTPSTPAFAGKSGMDLLREFLRQHVHEMPRTTLRYAIEKMDEEERKMWMQKPVVKNSYAKSSCQPKTSASPFLGKSMRELLEQILAGTNQDEIVVYLLKDRLKSQLQSIFSVYSDNLQFSFDELSDDFFLYLREGNLGLDKEPYDMLRSIRDKDAFEPWLLSTWRNYLSGAVRKTLICNNMLSVDTAHDNERKILIVSSLMAYADQEFFPRARFIFFRSMLTILNKQKALPDTEMADALGMSEISYRVTNYRLRKKVSYWRDLLLHGHKLPLDETHQEMAHAIDQNFENLYPTLMQSYTHALNQLEQKDAVDRLRMQYLKSEGWMLHDASSSNYSHMGIGLFWNKLVNGM